MAEREMESVSEATTDVAGNLLPWAVSVLVHAGVLMITLFVGYQVAVESGEPEDQIVVTGHFYNPSPAVLDLSPRNAPLTSGQVMTSPRGKTTFNPVRTIGDGGGKKRGLATRDSRVGVSNADPSGVTGWEGDWAEVGEGGDGDGPGDGRKKGVPLLGSPGGSTKVDTIFPPVPRGTNARKVVYLIDASGSLIDSMPFVLLELKKAILQTHPDQSFGIVFFYADRVIEFKPRELKAATVENREAALNWIDSGKIVPMGPTNPMKGLEAALSYGPDVVYLLSDNITGSGIYEVDQRRLLAAIKKANRNQAKISTIQFMEPDRLAAKGEPWVMERIATSTGGNFVYHSAKDLGLTADR